MNLLTGNDRPLLPLRRSPGARYFGVTLALNSGWPLLVHPLVVLVLDRYIIAREERDLAGAFPGEYEAYRAGCGGGSEKF